MAERHNVTPFHSPGTLPSLDTVAFEASPSGEVLIEYAAADLSQAGYSIRLKDLPDGERPRERLFALGPKSLSTAELLAVVLGPGQGSPGLSSVGLAQHVLSVLRDSNADALVKLQHIESGELLDIQGIGPAKAATLIAALELGKRVFQRRPLPGTVLDDPRVAADALAPQLMWETQEHLPWCVSTLSISYCLRRCSPRARRARHLLIQRMCLLLHFAGTQRVLSWPTTILRDLFRQAEMTSR